MARFAGTWRGILVGCLCAIGFGCGKSPPPAAKTTATATSPSTTADVSAPTEQSEPEPIIPAAPGDVVPVAAIGTSFPRSSAPANAEAGPTAQEPDELESAELKTPPQEGTAEWFVFETTKLRMRHPSANEDDPDAARTERKARNEKIIDYAQKAIAQTHDKPEKEPLFRSAVRHLIDARLQLALAGEKDHIEALYDDAAALAQRDPQSQTAAEAAHALVNLAYAHARSSQKDDTRWLQEFSFQASHFATQFPKEEPRSVPLVFTAARSCELFGLTREAMQGYALILEKFPENPYASRATGILRRLRLDGQAVEIAGPTLDGKQFHIESLRGKPVVVVFWSTEAQRCIEELPQIVQTVRKFSSAGVRVVGINLDTDTTAAKQFVITNKIGWPQIYYPASDKRGWKHPLVNEYGVMEIPSLWVLDAQGKVTSTILSSDELEGELTKVCGLKSPQSTIETNAETTAETKPKPKPAAKSRTASAKETDSE